jgi:hypothetical protein
MIDFCLILFFYIQWDRAWWNSRMRGPYGSLLLCSGLNTLQGPLPLALGPLASCNGRSLTVQPHGLIATLEICGVWDLKIWTGKFLSYAMLFQNDINDMKNDNDLLSWSSVAQPVSHLSRSWIQPFFSFVSLSSCNSWYSNVDNTVNVTIIIIHNIKIKHFTHKKQSSATWSRFHLDCCLVYLLLAGPAGGACSDVTCAGGASPVMSNNAISPAPQINLNN